MDIKVKSKFIKVSPQKVRPTLYGLRGENAEKALVSLYFLNKKGARLIHALLKSAIAAAKENDLDTSKTTIKEITCNEGPRLKRRLIGSRGRAKPILKRMSHLTITITDNIDVKDVKKTEIKKENNSKEK
jgi:large subunit ribosomal protein L22